MINGAIEFDSFSKVRTAGFLPAAVCFVDRRPCASRCHLGVSAAPFVSLFDMLRLSLLLLDIFRFVSARYGIPLSLQLYFKT